MKNICLLLKEQALLQAQQHKCAMKCKVTFYTEVKSGHSLQLYFHYSLRDLFLIVGVGEKIIRTQIKIWAPF